MRREERAAELQRDERERDEREREARLQLQREERAAELQREERPYFHSETYPASPPESTNTESVPSNSEILNDLHTYLQDRNSASLIRILKEHQKLFSDDPQECNVVQHDIQLLPDTRPIRQPFYRISPSKKEWASPCILVPKPQDRQALAAIKLKLELAKIEREQQKEALQIKEREAALKKEEQERKAALKKEEQKCETALKKEEQEREAALKECEAVL
ncbi:trichohyalin-like [Procambarus clarkii]|uniref:trichohyalin-like n=1 Tax=Procambarus clarkii TaxID=6728 RepID=UPI0037429CBB